MPLRRPIDQCKLQLVAGRLGCLRVEIQMEVISRVLLKNALESRSLPLLASQAGSLNGCLDPMTEWLAWSCWADWLLVVPVQDNSVHCLATAAVCIAGSGQAVPAEPPVSRASNARCNQVGPSSGPIGEGGAGGEGLTCVRWHGAWTVVDMTQSGCGA